MIRTYKYHLKPNKKQAAILTSWLETCRQLYNAALSEKRDAWCGHKKNISSYDQYKQLTELRKIDKEINSLPALVCRSPILSLQRAFNGFFRRVKAGEKPGYPRFRGKGRYASFSIGRATVEGKKVRVPNLGLVKFHKYREIAGTIRDVRVGLHAGKWFISFACDIGPAPEKKIVTRVVGIDVGLTSFATLSTGEKISNPRFFKQAEDKLAERQRKLVLKKKGSKSRIKAKELVAKAYQHINNQRLDFARKLVAELFNRFDLIAYEKLNIKNLTQNNLAKSINDAAWGLFDRALVSKAECAGKWAVPVNPYKTTMKCSFCGNEVKKEMRDRVHICLNCGLRLDRDENAARNILALGRSALVLGQCSSR